VNRLVAVLLGAALAAAAFGREPLPSVTPSETRGLASSDFRAVQESLSHVHPRMRTSWLRAHELDDSYYTTFRKPESTGLACIGRWPWGPSWELAGRDTFLYLGSGSGVRILSIADSVQPRMLGQINARGLVSQVVVQDSLLFVACGNWGAQIYSVADPASPRELGSMDAVIFDLVAKDTLCYTLGGDTFRIYDAANTAQPVQLSAIRDTGSVLAVTNGYAFTGGRWVMNVIDVGDPRSPHWVNSRAGVYLSLTARRNLLFQASYQPDFVAILDVSDPLNVTEVSRLDSLSADGMYVDDSLAYLAYGGLYVVDVSDSARPTLKGVSYHYDVEVEPFVFTPFSYVYLACRYGGLKVIDLHQATAPRETTTCFVAGGAADLSISGNVAFVSSGLAGVNTIDISDPMQPRDLGWLGALSGSDQLAHGSIIQDSLAFVGWQPSPYFRTLDVSDPTRPTYVGWCSAFEFAQDMVLRDSLIYCAENYKFQVVNIARPRAPEVVGTCDLPSSSYGMCLWDTLAFVSTLPLAIISVANPVQPETVGSIPYAWGVSVKDTLAYVGSRVLQAPNFQVWNVANPATPVVVDSIAFGALVYSTVVVDSLAYVGCEGVLRVLNVSDPHHMTVVAWHSLPHYGWRLVYDAPYVYVATVDGGVCIFETTAVGIAEPRQPEGMQARNGASVVSGVLFLEEATSRKPQATSLSDVSGRKVMALHPGANDVRALAPGVYFMREEPQAAGLKPQAVLKVILTR